MDDITPIPSGDTVPEFTLTDILSGDSIRLSTFKDQLTILNFWSIECPWSRHYDDYFHKRAAEWAEAGINTLFVNSNVNESADESRTFAQSLAIAHPVLIDPDSEVADLFGVQTTPHVYIINGDGVVIYQGAVDDRSFRQREATVNYLDAAVDALLNGNELPTTDTPAYGCTIVRMMPE